MDNVLSPGDGRAKGSPRSDGGSIVGGNEVLGKDSLRADGAVSVGGVSGEREDEGGGGVGSDNIGGAAEVVAINLGVAARHGESLGDTTSEAALIDTRDGGDLGSGNSGQEEDSENLDHHCC